MENINNALNLLYQISVKGDDVFRMADSITLIKRGLSDIQMMKKDEDLDDEN